MKLRAAVMALILSITTCAFAVGPSFTSYGKAWFEGQRGKFGYVDYWLGVDFTTVNVYLSKFVFKDSTSVGGATINRFVASQWQVVISAPDDRFIGLTALGTWNGMPAYGVFRLWDGKNRGSDRIEFRVTGIFGTPIYGLEGSVVSGDCRINYSP